MIHHPHVVEPGLVGGLPDLAERADGGVLRELDPEAQRDVCRSRVHPPILAGEHRW